MSLGKILMILSSALLFFGCGGGNSAAPPTAPITTPPSNNVSLLPSRGLDESTIEFNTTLTTLDNFSRGGSVIYPGDDLGLTWFMVANGESMTEDENGAFREPLYDGAIYFSDDAYLSRDVDTKLLDIECNIRVPNDDWPCNSILALTCQYADQNNNELKCTTIGDISAKHAIYNVTYDISSVLDTLPKETYMIYEICLRYEPTVCDTFAASVTFQ